MKFFKRYNIDQKTLDEIKKYYVLLHGPFPNDMYDFEEETNTSLDEFYEFFALITGSLNYIIEDKKIPRYQREMLKKTFYEHYPHFSNYKSEILKYQELSECLDFHEKIRILINKLIKGV
ncbi:MULTISPECIES: YxiJ family protein [unclassified Bacillus (in: firmicutes)]|uniref:YxiJ family protein n=1 Tax=unclassified Bacillus (in: firmicutes) TaxID=185979 RepID=UPI000976D513|nr:MULTISPECIES: YxiJ family protein [unclassified Bacillus (in: firmicutes)]MBW0259734.1 hypothetical protein [Bacillus sp. F2HM]OMP27927.1 hypothetical protein BAE31_07150 [Bacillus sp. I-2]